ncbi:reprolysin-like metallopeptidase [Chryseobacterium oryzae]|uniref:M12 family metallo-peptidase n=1 Tax=Chryseobacterium oryzae TaxID=2929799 RepID=A0ABY4BMB0_9FLAO|nr:zinc-dependent metalloprotease family protein [Chryseobacterium oryzae]UOE38896.1 M12 family metallo-peptidase [Chryseobacterium oryzae]
MKKKLLVLGAVLVFSAMGFAQQNQWGKLGTAPIGEIRESNAKVSNYSLFTLNVSELQNKLKDASDRDYKAYRKGITLNFPNTSGTFDAYEVYESSTMHPDLQNRYSDIKSYIGFKKGDKSATLRFTLDPYFGFNGMVAGNDGIYYIDSYTEDNHVYRIYNRKDASSTIPFECLFKGDSDMNDVASVAQKTVIDGLKRKYRLSISTTVEYTAYIAGQAGVGSGTVAQKKAAVLAAVNLAVARLNEVYERDMSIRLQLIANTDALFFISSDTFDQFDASQMLNENVTVTNSVIGAANYDIGHLFFKVDNANDNNGLAATPSVCGTYKAGGVTGCVVPVGDPFVIDFVAHEMGHQFGAMHTQNNACNRNVPTTVEPGSASTIMGYAGICPPNVQQNSDAYFHSVSINQMYNAFTSGGTSQCADKTPIANSEPIVNAGLDRSIPKSTPFMLTATATDADNDPLTYDWEQIDAGVAPMPPVGTSTVGPLFRSLMPTSSPSRYFPKLATIVNPANASIWEVLPSAARNLNFSVLVRDNNPLGGQTGRDDIKLTVVSSAGPFTVTSQNTPGVVWNEGQSQTVTWDVANTTAAPVSTPNVSILLSTDGGVTFPFVLVASTPNDGTHTFTVPGNLGTSSNSRIMVKAVDNVFLNVNSQNFTVNSSAVVIPPVNPGNPSNPGTPGNPGTTPSVFFEGMMIYPVPSYDGYVYIKLDFPRLNPLRPYAFNYTIYAMDGKLVIPKRSRLFFSDHLEKIDLRHLPTETYMIEVELEGNKIVKKLVMFNNK